MTLMPSNALTPDLTAERHAKKAPNKIQNNTHHGRITYLVKNCLVAWNSILVDGEVQVFQCELNLRDSHRRIGAPTELIYTPYIP